MSLIKTIFDLFKVPEIALDVYQSILPLVEETAGELFAAQTEAAIAAIVISEIGDSDQAVQYIQSFRIIKVANNHHQVRFVSASDKIRSLERGIKSFSIKDKMLHSGRAGVKFSKDGFLYRTVPLSKDLENQNSGGGSKKEQAIRDKISEILKNSKFSFKAAFQSKKTGEYHVTEQAPGMKRYSVYENQEAYNAGEKSRRSRVVVFRTMSSRPGTSEWLHPGAKGKNIEQQVRKWLQENEQMMFEENIKQLISDR